MFTLCSFFLSLPFPLLFLNLFPPTMSTRASNFTRHFPSKSFHIYPSKLRGLPEKSPNYWNANIIGLSPGAVTRRFPCLFLPFIFLSSSVVRRGEGRSTHLKNLHAVSSKHTYFLELFVCAYVSAPNRPWAVLVADCCMPFSATDTWTYKSSLLVVAFLIYTAFSWLLTAHITYKLDLGSLSHACCLLLLTCHPTV